MILVDQIARGATIALLAVTSFVLAREVRRVPSAVISYLAIRWRRTSS